MSIKKNPFFWLIMISFIVSRFLFLAKYPFFYDSPEYLKHAQATDYFQTLAVVHIPAHPIYLLLIQKFHQWFSFLPVAVSTSLVSAIFGLVGFVSFYFLVRRLFGNKIALLSLLPLIFFSHLWLVQTNILHETAEQGFFLLGLLAFDIYLERKNLIWFLITVGSFGLSIMNFFGIVIWFPVIFGLIYYRLPNPGKLVSWSRGLKVIFASFFIGLLGLYLLLAISTKNPGSHFSGIVFGYGTGGLLSDLSLINLMRVLRNDFLILVNGYSIFTLPVVILVLIRLFLEKRYREVIFLISFFIPFLLTGKFWYGGLYGRYSTLAAYVFGLCYGLLISQSSYLLMIGGLAMTFLPTFLIYQQKPIYLMEKNMIDKVRKDKKDLLILSDYQRPQLPLDNTMFANGSLFDQKKIEEAITLAFSEKRRVFISEQAVTFPYYQYDGQQLHIISRGDVKKSLFYYFIKDKKLVPVVSDGNYPLLTIYEINPVSR